MLNSDALASLDAHVTFQRDGTGRERIPSYGLLSSLMPLLFREQTISGTYLVTAVALSALIRGVFLMGLRQTARRMVPA